MLSPPAPRHLVPLRPKCLPQQPILEHPQPVVTPQYGRPNFLLYILILVFLHSNRKAKPPRPNGQAFPVLPCSYTVISTRVKPASFLADRLTQLNGRQQHRRSVPTELVHNTGFDMKYLCSTLSILTGRPVIIRRTSALRHYRFCLTAG
jgi:hypothetical protein